MMKTLKRYLYLVHRWFGVAMCLLFALWFASGVILMYVDYPELTEDERFDMLPALQTDGITVDPQQAIALAGMEPAQLAALRLSTVLGRPAWLLSGPDGLQTVFADTGERLAGLTEQQAILAVRHSGFWQEGASPVLERRLDMDQWTVSSVLHPHRPLHKVVLGDGAGTVLYVSEQSGQIVRDTRRSERVWNWLGSTIHWIYPVQLRRNPDLWAEVVIYLSLAGMVSVVTGGIIGFMRLRVRKPYKGERMSPYHGVDKWHHVLGLWSLLFVCTFMFSGLMSMSPWGIFDSQTSAGEQVARYTGGNPADLSTFPALPSTGLEPGVKEVEWRQVGGEGYLVMAAGAHDRWVYWGGRDGERAGRKHAGDLLRQRIDAQLQAFLPDATIVTRDVLTRYDNYYYSTHGRYRPLPVLRVRFDDPERIWFHIDLNTGEVLNRLTDRGRLARWLYNGLHSLDFSFLIQNRPVWDVVVILLSIIGLVFSVTSIMIGWRRLLR